MSADQSIFLTNPIPSHQWEKALLYILWCIAFILPLTRWFWHTGNPLDYITYGAPIGQIPYLFSKLMALFALALLIMQFLLIALHRTGVLSSWSIQHHAWVGMGILFCALAHVGLFVTGKSMRGGYLDLMTVVPDFSHGFYKSMLSLGSLALVGLMITVAVGVCRRQYFGNKNLALLHKVSFVTAGLIVFHCLAVGSEV